MFFGENYISYFLTVWGGDEKLNSQKKLVACSILALIIGVSSVIPLVFLMSTTAEAEDTFEPQFSFNIPYSYWVTMNMTFDYSFESDFFNDNIEPYVNERHVMVFNLTRNANTEYELAERIVEYYRIEITTDKGPINNVYYTVGTALDSSSVMQSFHFIRDFWFDTAMFDPKYGGGGGYAKDNWPVGLSVLRSKPDVPNSETPKVVSALREAETVFITVYRIGGVIFTESSTVVTFADNEFVDQIRLEKYGEEGWLYNNLFTEEELATVDLLFPIPFGPNS
ncbi:MAG: hypothetical protein CW716_06860 [Candidatus Bathyarchaeum sp.]|nr:MAG: hypothetical protein CW716_06860 [Candidatus Bathyarchaeum sp.]